ncbi:NAD(P)/FAD-dependent oxidoreductase [Rhodovulum sp. MB263]|uniref:NAD(P)/FAD-dependent oxidoreductase n=1 Tax=Rhodovulum sp. (strain MB263) TaxID=308754 RepID=UPI0009B74247|nr:FAD-dependent oxidoreductase [Rhodovulum sp. MB263]ARC87418.1 cyclopropane-fatty-acyl-phospholipid synthase [Rhodovulum sp. MB263]
MPIDSAGGRRRIAVIGGGISGMGAAHLLAGTARVTLFEAEGRLGGHARTVLAGRHGDRAVDTGFIVFNRVNYPHMVRLFEKLGVPVAKSDMSFGASFDGGAFEYGLKNLRAVFAQPANALNPRFWGMLRDVTRFNARAMDEARDPSVSLGDFLAALGTGDWFRDRYLLPLSGAIWSTPSQGILDFPAQALIRFFDNHALLSTSGQHQWYTVEGGSVEYVRRLEAALAAADVEIRKAAPVEAVRRDAEGAEIRARGGEWDRFDEVVFATHSDDSLAMLSDATPEERAALSAVRYQPNEAVLHADPALMPKRRAVWSSWNYAEASGARAGRIDLTYWMNSLQPIPKDDPLFVTLNSRRPIRDELIYDTATFRHPVYDRGALEAQQAVRRMNGTNRTWFCGAWMRNGFHEDGLASAVDVAEAMLGGRPEAVAA